MIDKQINTKHEKAILDIIPNNPIYNFGDIFVFYKGCSRPTAYNHGLDKLDSIKEAIYSNRRTGVTTLIDKWLKSENATLQMGAMKLICDPDEHKRLNPNYEPAKKPEETDKTIVILPAKDIIPQENVDNVE